jgi:predicted small secreted protein
MEKNMMRFIPYALLAACSMLLAACGHGGMG